MKKLEKFQSENFEKEIRTEDLKKIKGGLKMYGGGGVTLSGCECTSVTIDDCSDTDPDCPPPT
jgi:hypothetical protein